MVNMKARLVAHLVLILLVYFLIVIVPLALQSIWSRLLYMLFSVIVEYILIHFLGQWVLWQWYHCGYNHVRLIDDHSSSSA